MLDKNNYVLSERWKAEFAGLFLGEGCLHLGKVTRQTKSGTYVIYRPEAIISLRADDLHLLEEIQSKLGGRLTKYRRNPNKQLNDHDAYRWYVQSKEDCLRVADILSECILPAKKLEELPAWRESLELRKSRGVKHTQEENERLEFLFHEIKRIRVFKVP